MCRRLALAEEQPERVSRIIKNDLESIALFRSFHFKSLAEFRPLKEDGIKINLKKVTTCASLFSPLSLVSAVA